MNDNFAQKAALKQQVLTSLKAILSDFNTTFPPANPEETPSFLEEDENPLEVQLEQLKSFLQTKYSSLKSQISNFKKPQKTENS